MRKAVQSLVCCVWEKQLLLSIIVRYVDARSPPPPIPLHTSILKNITLTIMNWKYLCSNYSSIVLITWSSCTSGMLIQQWRRGGGLFTAKQDIFDNVRCNFISLMCIVFHGWSKSVQLSIPHYVIFFSPETLPVSSMCSSTNSSILVRTKSFFISQFNSLPILEVWLERVRIELDLIRSFEFRNNDATKHNEKQNPQLYSQLQYLSFLW